MRLHSWHSLLRRLCHGTDQTDQRVDGVLCVRLHRRSHRRGDPLSRGPARRPDEKQRQADGPAIARPSCVWGGARGWVRCAFWRRCLDSALGAAPHPPAGTFSPQAGRRDLAATLASPWHRLRSAKPSVTALFSPLAGRRSRQGDEGRRGASSGGIGGPDGARPAPVRFRRLRWAWGAGAAPHLPVGIFSP